MVLTLIGGVAGAGVGAAAAAARRGIAGVGGVANIITNKIDFAQIVKYAILFAIFLVIVILALSMVRGVYIAALQIACAPLNLFDSYRCDPFHTDTAILDPGGQPAIDMLWEAEWGLRCLLFLDLAFIMLILLYIWGRFVMDLLLNVDRHIQRFDDWIHGEKRWLKDEPFY